MCLNWCLSTWTVPRNDWCTCPLKSNRNTQAKQLRWAVFLDASSCTGHSCIPTWVVSIFIQRLIILSTNVHLSCSSSSPPLSWLSSMFIGTTNCRVVIVGKLCHLTPVGCSCTLSISSVFHWKVAPRPSRENNGLFWAKPNGKLRSLNLVINNYTWFKRNTGRVKQKKLHKYRHDLKLLSKFWSNF